MKSSIQILSLNDRVITDKKEILEYFSEGLRKKYLQSSNPFRDTKWLLYLSNNIRQKLNEHEKRVLDEPISLKELKQALMNIKKGKTPGSNGFTSEFFKHFWEPQGIFLYRAWIERFEDNKNLNSHNESIVKLIPKPGVPNDSPKGWRPISLLNVDFKIISAAIANRLKTVIHKLVSPSQTAYIPGRFIGENSRLLYDVIECLNNQDRSGIVMGVDFEAAFDTVSWEFLSNALEKYNFGHYFRKLVNVLFLNADLNSRILLDGNLGTKVFMQRGIRQGDPISGYLFNLVMEPLAHQLNTSPLIKGIDISDSTEVRLSQYADDLIVFSSANTCSIKGILHELNNYSKISGLKVNVQKTKCLPIGQVQTDTLMELGLSVVTEMKILGIVYNKNNNNITTNNVRRIIAKIKHDIAQWRRRHLT